MTSLLDKKRFKFNRVDVAVAAVVAVAVVVVHVFTVICVQQCLGKDKWCKYQPETYLSDLNGQSWSGLDRDRRKLGTL